MSHNRNPTAVNDIMEFILFVLSYATSGIHAEIRKCVAPKEIK